MIYKDIRLRAPEPEDLDLMYQWENDTDIWQFGNTISPISKYTLRRFIEQSGRTIYETLQMRFMIDINKSNLTIGAIDLFEFDPFHQRVGTGIIIADKESRKKGYARQSVELIIDYCFNKLSINQIYCNILSDNTESIKLYNGLGFKLSGVKKEWIRSGDSYKDENFYQLLNTKVD